MIYFLIAFFGLVIFVFIVQIISKMKIIGGNELGIISGKGNKKGFTTISGGRAFVIPLFNKFEKINLTPYTIEVIVESAIAKGIVPLNVKATVSFSISSSKAGRDKAASRILRLSQNSEKLCSIASSIIEGHLRDAIAPMTPEQVMQDKDTLVANMINVCKSELENIGLEITTMNIADVDDHRLDGVTEKNLYIDLLKRIQTTNAECQARIAKANADANSTEQEQERRAETEVRKYENLYENYAAETRVKIANENQRKAVGVEQALKNAEAKTAGLIIEIESEKQKNEMLEKKYEAEIDKLKETVEMLNKKGKVGAQAYVIENFAQTLSFFKIDKLSVITGVEGNQGPISAIHPSAIDEQKNKLIENFMTNVTGINKTNNVKEKDIKSIIGEESKVQK